MDDEKIARLTDPVKLRNLMKNALARGRRDVHDKALRQLVSLEGMVFDDPLERDFYVVLNAYEELLTKRNGRKTKAVRTRRKLADKGVRGCLLDWTIGRETEGFDLLTSNGLYELTAEYIVLKHRDRFPEEAIRNARDRLVSRGFAGPS